MANEELLEGQASEELQSGTDEIKPEAAATATANFANEE